MKSITVELDDDTYNYLEFLERMRFIRSKEEALHRSLILFKKLSMHDWLNDVYRIGESRVLLIDRGMLLDIFELLTEFELYRAGSMTALKRKILKPEFKDIDLTKPSNWLIVLKELENFGWGTFSRVENEIKIENCAVPIQYIRGYLESMFKVKLEEHKTQIEGLTVLIAQKQKKEEWR